MNDFPRRNGLSIIGEQGGPSGAPPKPPARFARVNPAPLVIELGDPSGAPPKPPARFAGVNPAPLVIELGGASGAPPKPPARFAGVNPAPLAALALFPLLDKLALERDPRHAQREARPPHERPRREPGEQEVLRRDRNEKG